MDGEEGKITVWELFFPPPKRNPRKKREFNSCDERKRIRVLSRKKLLWAVVNRRKNTWKHVRTEIEREQQARERDGGRGHLSRVWGCYHHAFPATRVTQEVKALNRGVRWQGASCPSLINRELATTDGCRLLAQPGWGWEWRLSD